MVGLTDVEVKKIMLEVAERIEKLAETINPWLKTWSQEQINELYVEMVEEYFYKALDKKNTQ